MSNLESAYQSLDNAKKEQQELIVKKERFDEIYAILEPYCHEFIKYRTIPDAIERVENDKRRQISNIFLALSIYVAVFGIVGIIGVFGFGNTGLVTTLVGSGIGSFSVCSYRFFKEIFKDNKKIKELEGVEETLSGDAMYEGKVLDSIISLVYSEIELLRDKIDIMGSSIKEYEAALGEANRELAEEVLASSGIEASVTLNSNMKVLAKRYEENKK